MKHTVSQLKLGNGAQGLLIHVPDATVMTYDFSFRAGEYLVQRSNWETPHLMEHLMLGANQLVPKARNFLAEFEKNGAYTNASTSSYDINYEAECADFEWDRILGLLLVSMTKPLFLQSEFEAELGNVKEELTARSNNHFRHLSICLREAYGFQAVTDQERLQLIDNVGLSDIRRHFKTTHTSSNMRFVIAGNLPIERRRIIKALLGSIELPKGDGRTAMPIEIPRPLEQPLTITNDSVDNVYFYVDTFKSRKLSDPEGDALGLLNTMLTETLNSRILGTAREKGLVYSLNSGYSQTPLNSNWWFGAQVMPRNAAALFKIIVSELKAVQNGDLSDEDVQAAKQYAVGRYQRSAQTVGGTAAGYSYRYFFDDAVEDYYQLPTRLKAITKQRIIKVANSMFEDKIWGLGTLGNSGQEFSDKLYDQLRVLW
ncbi:MAG: pitrilysin family protein [Candidatus Saccharimonadales bacterium]